MTDEHIPGVYSLLGECFVDPWSLTVIETTLDRRDVACLVAEEDEHIVAFLAFEKILDEGSVEMIAVAPSFRRRGLAKNLLELTMSFIGGLCKVTLEVRASNTPAIRLYESLGFSPIAVRRAYYADNGEDALVMQKTEINESKEADSVRKRELFGDLATEG